MPIRFESEVKTVPFGGGTIRIENLTPVLSPKDREKRKREIEIPCLTCSASTGTKSNHPQFSEVEVVIGSRLRYNILVGWLPEGS
jgi:hypothetical protein